MVADGIVVTSVSQLVSVLEDIVARNTKHNGCKEGDSKNIDANNERDVSQKKRKSEAEDVQLAGLVRQFQPIVDVPVSTFVDEQLCFSAAVRYGRDNSGTPHLFHLVDAVYQDPNNPNASALLNLVYLFLCIFTRSFELRHSLAARMARSLLSDHIRVFYRALGAHSPSLAASCFDLLAAMVWADESGGMAEAMVAAGRRKRKSLEEGNQDSDAVVSASTAFDWLASKDIQRYATLKKTRSAFVRLIISLLERTRNEVWPNLVNLGLHSWLINGDGNSHDGLATDPQDVVMQVFLALSRWIERWQKNSMSSISGGQIGKAGLVRITFTPKILATLSAFVTSSIDKADNPISSIAKKVILQVGKRYQQQPRQLIEFSCQSLDPLMNEAHRDLILELMKSVGSEFAHGYWKISTFNFEPELSLKFISLYSFACESLTGLSMNSSLSDHSAQSDGLVIRGISRGLLNRGLLHDNRLVQFHTLALLKAILLNGSCCIQFYNTIPDFKTISSLWAQLFLENEEYTATNEALLAILLSVVWSYASFGLADLSNLHLFDKKVLDATTCSMAMLIIYVKVVAFLMQKSPVQFLLSAANRSGLVNLISNVKKQNNDGDIIDCYASTLVNTALEATEMFLHKSETKAWTRVICDNWFPCTKKSKSSSVSGSDIFAEILDLTYRQIERPTAYANVERSPLHGLLYDKFGKITILIDLSELKLMSPPSKNNLDIVKLLEQKRALDQGLVQESKESLTEDRFPIENIQFAVPESFIDSVFANARFDAVMTALRKNSQQFVNYVDPETIEQTYYKLVRDADISIWLRFLSWLLEFNESEEPESNFFRITDQRLQGLIERGWLGFAFKAASSRQPDLRKAGHHVLRAFQERIYRSDIRERRQIQALMDGFVSGLDKEKECDPCHTLPPIIPFVFGSWMVHAMVVMLDPLHLLYTTIMDGVLLSSPVIYHDSVPMWRICMHGLADERLSAGISWILRVLEDGLLGDLGDHSIYACRASHVQEGFETLLLLEPENDSKNNQQSLTCLPRHCFSQARRICSHLSSKSHVLE